MGLDAFKSGSSDTNDKSSESNSSDDNNTGETTQDTQSVDLDGTELVEIPEDPTGSDPDTDYHSEYDEEYLKQCWRCSSKSILIRWLSDLGNIWFCESQDCRNSVKHHCEVTASSKQTAEKLDYQSLHSEMSQETFHPRDMTIEDFTLSGTDSDSSGSKRESQMFSKERFEEVLSQTEYTWKPKDYDWTKEWVYEVASGEGQFVMRVYSSVDKRDGKSRPKDSDAIRLVVLHEDTNKPVLAEKRTNRIKTWAKNLKQKINNISNRKDELEWCNECGSVMLIRENSKTGNEFYGCSNYPDCENTKPIN